MAKIRILKSSDFKENETASYSFGSIIIQTTAKGLLGYKLDNIEDTVIKAVEIITEENSKSYSLKNGLIGGALTGGIGLLAGFVLSKNKNNVLFKLIFNDNRSFIGETDKKTFNKLLLKTNLLSDSNEKNKKKKLIKQKREIKIDVSPKLKTFNKMSKEEQEAYHKKMVKSIKTFFKTIKTFFKTIFKIIFFGGLILVIIGVFIPETEKAKKTIKTEKVKSVETTKKPMVKYKYKLLKKKVFPAVQNLNYISLEKNNSKKVLEGIVANILSEVDCEAKKCNIYVWNNKKAFTTNWKYENPKSYPMTKQGIKKRERQRDRNYIFWAEHLLVSKTFDSKELWFSPLKDWHYKELKAKK